MKKPRYMLKVRFDFAAEPMGSVQHSRLVRSPRINTLPNLWHAMWLAHGIQRYGLPDDKLTIWIES